MLTRIRRPRYMKRVIAALREAQRPLTAADLSIICDLTSSTVARLLRTLRDYGYPLQMIPCNNRATEYRLVEEPATQRG